MSNQHKQGQTFKTECKRGRITYHPEWSESQPWAAYIEGTATRHFENPQAAFDYFHAKGMRLIF